MPNPRFPGLKLLHALLAKISITRPGCPASIAQLALHPQHPQLAAPARQLSFNPPVSKSKVAIKRRLLDLLSAPASIRLAHVRGGLDGRDELEGDVGDADDADDGAGNDPDDAVVQKDAANKDVDCATLISPSSFITSKEGGTYRYHGRGTRTGTRRSEKPGAESGTLHSGLVSVRGVGIQASENVVPSRPVAIITPTVSITSFTTSPPRKEDLPAPKMMT
jgi:hypothetical protein